MTEEGELLLKSAKEFETNSILLERKLKNKSSVTKRYSIGATWEKGSGTRMIFENKLKELGHNLADMKIYMEVGSIGAIKSLVEANLGYTVISREAVKRELDSGTLTIIPIQGIRIIREFNFVFLDQSPKDFIDDFMSFLVINQSGHTG